MPKIHSSVDLHQVSWEVYNIARTVSGRSTPVQIIASIESAEAMVNLGKIASWKSEHGPAGGGKLFALLVCAPSLCSVAYTY